MALAFTRATLAALSAGMCMFPTMCQIWIDPPESGKVGLHAADVETRNDEEMRQDWYVPVHDLEQALEEALAFVQQWIKRND